MSTAIQPEVKTVACPFAVVIDTREQLPYRFEGLWEGPAHGPKSRLIEVPRIRGALGAGDYSIRGFEDRVTIERKSKEDLYGSISQRRENFVERLERMSRCYETAIVMVEAEWLELLTAPPKHTKYAPKSLSRTLDAWILRYPVKWFFMPSRDHAERKTFHLLNRWWKDQQERPRERFDPGLLDAPLSDPDAEA